jgi:hypothetical protein
MNLFAAGLLMAVSALAQLPAFPGAEGYGSQTPGGRGGKVLIVANLNDSGRGSLRAALEAEGPRIVAFRVSGIIDLKTPIRITQPFVTVAGQSAPGGGITLRGHGIAVNTHDVVIRHLRARPGDLSGDEVDGIAIGGASRNVVIDHCSVSWSVDENLSPSGAISDVTVQWSIIAEGLNRSVHAKGAHGYGSLVRASGGLTLHHNLWAHNPSRNPRLGCNYGRPPFPRFDVRNNVIYNAGGPNVAGDTFEANYLANYHKPGPDSPPGHPVFSPTEKAALTFHFAGNHPTDLRWSTRPGITTVDQPFDAPPVRTTSAAIAYQEVLAHAGATAPRRDPVDERIIREVREGSGAHIDSQFEVGGWPAVESGRPPRDTDRDGMPDDWELSRGLNPRDPADAALKAPSGYTWIEEYLNELAAAGTLR